MSVTMQRSDRPIGERTPMPANRYVAALAVEIVDSQGESVPYEPVTARFYLDDGYERVVARSADSEGRVSFVEELTMPAKSVVIVSGGETTGEITPPRGTSLVIEV